MDLVKEIPNDYPASEESLDILFRKARNPQRLAPQAVSDELGEGLRC